MDMTLLINGEIAFKQIIKRINEAKYNITINMYIWRDDRIGNKIANALLDAANRGVKVRIIKDINGSVFEKSEENRQSFFSKNNYYRLYFTQYIFTKSYFKYITNSTKQNDNKVLNQMIEHDNIIIESTFRNDHSKFYIFDEKILILGGINIEDKELYTDLKNKKYSDYMIEIVDEESVKYFSAKLNEDYDKTNEIVDFYFNISKKKIYQVKPQILTLMDEATKQIDIEMAYFGDKAITNKIIECSKKGIQVSIITSKEANVQNDYNYHILNKIHKQTKGKVNILLSNRMVHSKFMCVDGEKFFFGSANFNRRGMVTLSELNIFIKDNGKLFKEWNKWRKEHIDECVTYSPDLKYRKHIALLESLVC